MSATPAATPEQFSALERGSEYTTGYQVYIEGSDGPISAFHDIPLCPLRSNINILNMVVEMPRWTNAKMKMAKNKPLNPIMQDTENDELQFVPNIFPSHGCLWNCGFLPQTWENPRITDERAQIKDHNDALDVIEIGDKVHKCGAVIQVKLLGALGLIQEGETDWKMIAIDVTDPRAKQLSTLDDIRKHMPWMLEKSSNWLCCYKLLQSTILGSFTVNIVYTDTTFAYKAAREAHTRWDKLFDSQVEKRPDICYKHRSFKNSIKRPEAEQFVEKAPQPAAPSTIPDAVSDWSFVTIQRGKETAA